MAFDNSPASPESLPDFVDQKPHFGASKWRVVHKQMDAYRIWMPLQTRQVFFLERETVSSLCKMHLGGCWNAYLHSIIPCLASRYSHIFRFDDSDVD